MDFWSSSQQEGSLWRDISKVMQEGMTGSWISFIDVPSARESEEARDLEVPEDGELYGHFADNDTLCPLMVVQDEAGITLTIDGELLPQRQQTVLSVHQRIRPGRPDRSRPGVDGTLLKLYVAENGEKDGLLLESTLGFQVALVDTRLAFNRSEHPSADILEPPAEQLGSAGPDVLHYRKDLGHLFAVATRIGGGMVEIRRADAGGLQEMSSPAGQQEAPVPVLTQKWTLFGAGAQTQSASTIDIRSTDTEGQYFCVENRINSESAGLAYRNSKNLSDTDPQKVAKWGTVVYGVRDDKWLRVGDQYLPIKYDCVRLLRPQGQLLMMVRIEAACQSANIVDGNGLLLATMQTRRNEAGDQMMIVQVGQGVDAGLLIAALAAALKLAKSA
jgi:hypothetical protein